MSYKCDECGENMHIEILPDGCTSAYCSQECRLAEKFRECAISSRNSAIDEVIQAIKSCELVSPNVKRIHLYEALGVLVELKQLNKVGGDL
jgi:hypothetical protein